jgi:hypothetical protein
MEVLSWVKKYLLYRILIKGEISKTNSNDILPDTVRTYQLTRSYAKIGLRLYFSLLGTIVAYLMTFI